MAQVITAPAPCRKCDTLSTTTMRFIHSSQRKHSLLAANAGITDIASPPISSARPETTSIAAAYRQISDDITACAINNNRANDAVRLLAVSKTRTAAEVNQAYEAGARHFGENYLQDALPKIAALADRTDISWHYIGAIQSNKTKDIAANFDWVHTVDRLKIARRLSNARGEMRTPGGEQRTPLNIALQVNLHNEPQKAGCAPEALSDLADALAELPHLALRGLMILPAVEVAPEEAFAQTAELFAQLAAQLTNRPARWDTLSMGMSGDYHAAIEAGSTIVRIGTALFGPRAN